MYRSLPLRCLLLLRPGRHELGIVALVDEELAVQSGVLHLPPAPPRQRRAVCAVAAFPGPLHGWLTVPCGQPPVDQTLDVAELERAAALLLELDECLDIFIEIVVLPGRHRDDAPTTREWRFLLLLAHRHSPRCPA